MLSTIAQSAKMKVDIYHVFGNYGQLETLAGKKGYFFGRFLSLSWPVKSCFWGTRVGLPLHSLLAPIEQVGRCSHREMGDPEAGEKKLSPPLLVHPEQTMMD